MRLPKDATVVSFVVLNLLISNCAGQLVIVMSVYAVTVAISRSRMHVDL